MEIVEIICMLVHGGCVHGLYRKNPNQSYQLIIKPDCFRRTELRCQESSTWQWSLYHTPAQIRCSHLDPGGEVRYRLSTAETIPDCGLYVSIVMIHVMSWWDDWHCAVLMQREPVNVTRWTRNQSFNSGPTSPTLSPRWTNVSDVVPALKQR